MDAPPPTTAELQAALADPQVWATYADTYRQRVAKLEQAREDFRQAEKQLAAARTAAQLAHARLWLPPSQLFHAREWMQGAVDLHPDRPSLCPRCQHALWNRNGRRHSYYDQGKPDAIEAICPYPYDLLIKLCEATTAARDIATGVQP